MIYVRLSKYAITRILTEESLIDRTLVSKGLPEKAVLKSVGIDPSNELNVLLAFEVEGEREDRNLTIEFSRAEEVSQVEDSEKKEEAESEELPSDADDNKKEDSEPQE